jgi:hypothetical protein
MDKIFSDSGLSLKFFIEISATFILTMLMFLDQKVYRRSKWVHHLSFCGLVGWWVLALAFETLETKMYATLMLMTVVVVETVIRRKRKQLS